MVVLSPPRCRKGEHLPKAAQAQKIDRSMIGRPRCPCVECVFFVFKLKNGFHAQNKDKDKDKIIAR